MSQVGTLYHRKWLLAVKIRYLLYFCKKMQLLRRKKKSRKSEVKMFSLLFLIQGKRTQTLSKSNVPYSHKYNWFPKYQLANKVWFFKEYIIDLSCWFMRLRVKRAICNTALQLHSYVIAEIAISSSKLAPRRPHLVAKSKIRSMGKFFLISWCHSR